jgi:hypothetical protein
MTGFMTLLQKISKKLKNLLTEEMKFSILNKLLFEAANISKKALKKSSKNFLTKR